MPRGPGSVLAVVAVFLAVGAIAALAGADPIATVAWVIAAIVPLVTLVRGMVADLRSGRIGVDVIAVLAIGGALAIGEYLTAAIIGLMLATGEFLEAYAAGRAERELTSLVERAPKSAHLVTDGGVETVDIGTVTPGNLLLVKPGEVVPVDGLLRSDHALLDESAITGESAPVRLSRTERVSSGTVNAAGPFRIRALTSADEGTYAGIVRLVEAAARDRPPAVRLADRWAAWFIPLTLAVAAAAWGVSGDATRALAVLVVATPCPLLLAVPIAIVSGMSRAAGNGVIFRGGGPLEALARTELLLLDKTGTLTIGYPVVHQIAVFDPAWSEEDALRLAASVDQTSTHILARALVNEATGRGMVLSLPGSVHEEAGKGIGGDVDGRWVTIGTARWTLGTHDEPDAVRAFRRATDRAGPLSTFIGVDGVLVAGVSFMDVIRPDAATTIRALRRAGIRRIVMATGDHPTVAHAVGLAVGVDSVLPQSTPLEKVEAVQDMRTEAPTAMAGDGINDAPALAAADVGIAMGARGATASSEAADVVIMVDRLNAVVTAIRIAHRSRKVALQSVLLGMGLSLAAMGGAAVGLITPIAGAVLQELIDLAAIGNALRALRGDRSRSRAPKLPEELSRSLQRDHDILMPKVDRIADTADRLDDLEPVDAGRQLREIEALLQRELLPHEREDEERVYPVVAQLIGGEDPLQSMSRSHREIFHLAHRFGRMVDEMPREGPDQQDIPELRRLLYSLHAILRLHFDQEEELYASLDETYRNAGGSLAVTEPRR
jgi:heavy metal translocating P-type ATPase